MPKGYKKGTPLAAVMWLHGLGSRPEDFVNSGTQDYAGGNVIAAATPELFAEAKGYFAA